MSANPLKLIFSKLGKAYGPFPGKGVGKIQLDIINTADSPVRIRSCAQYFENIKGAIANTELLPGQDADIHLNVASYGRRVVGCMLYQVEANESAELLTAKELYILLSWRTSRKGTLYAMLHFVENAYGAIHWDTSHLRQYYHTFVVKRFQKYREPLSQTWITPDNANRLSVEVRVNSEHDLTFSMRITKASLEIPLDKLPFLVLPGSTGTIDWEMQDAESTPPQRFSKAFTRPKISPYTRANLIIQNQCDALTMHCPNITLCDKLDQHPSQTEIPPYKAGEIELRLVKHLYDFNYNYVVADLNLQPQALEAYYTDEVRRQQPRIVIHLYSSKRSATPIIIIQALASPLPSTPYHIGYEDDCDSSIISYHDSVLHQFEYTGGPPAQYCMEDLNLRLDVFFEYEPKPNLYVRVAPLKHHRILAQPASSICSSERTAF